MRVNRTRQLLTVLAVLAFSPGAVCLGELPPTLAGTWSGTCELGRNVPFTLQDMVLVAEGDDILLDATGTWALYQGTGAWDGVEGFADMAVCVDEVICGLDPEFYRPNDIIAVWDVAAQPALVGEWDLDATLAGDCYAGNQAGTFTASR